MFLERSLELIQFALFVLLYFQEFTKSLKEVELFESDGTNLNSKINSYIDSSWKDNCNRDEKLGNSFI